jgi:glycosyltransferase involved in cell wall biosynthesis
MNNASPILTVIIITYNHRDFIARAIESVLEQETTYPYQLWITDDCSTDGTLEICNSYAERYSDKVKTFAHDVNTFSTPGVVRHTEIAIKGVKTKYFCVLDGDDSWCDSHKIQIALDFLENNPEYTTFAHDTWYYDNVIGTKRSLVHDIHRTEIQNPVHFENAPYLHTSSRIHRNIVKYSSKQNTNGDIYLFYIYLNQGPLYYYDKVMSVYNVTGRGDWSGLSQAQKYRVGITTQYKLNKYFNYKYDSFFTRRLGETKGLESYKKIFGKRLGWELWYHLEFMNAFSLQHIKSKFKEFAFKVFPKQ